MDSEVARSYSPQVLSILQGKKLEIELETDQNVIVSYFDDDDDEPTTEQVDGKLISQIDQPNSVVILPICGPIMKYDFCGEAGMETRARQLREAYANPNVSGVILQVDTPGGESQACGLMTKAIAQRNKPVIALVDGMMCSAGMFICAGCDAIYANAEDSIIGSIGTMISFADTRGWKEYEGIKFHEIYADQSVDKNKDFRDALEGEYSTIKASLLNPMNKLFVDHVTKNRPNLNREATLTGKIFLSSQAKAHGLIDDIQDIDFAINQVIIMFNSKFKKLEAFRGKKDLTPEQIAEVQKILQEGGIAVTLATPSSMLLETEGDEPSIYVYAEEGEDPVGKRCVKADPEGNPTEENLEDGEHALADGRTLTSSTKDDGMSYVDSITEGESEEGDGGGEGAADKTTESSQEELVAMITQQIEAKFDAKLKEIKNQMVLGKTPPRQVNGGNQLNGAKFKPSAFDRKRKEIQERYSGKK